MADEVTVERCPQRWTDKGLVVLGVPLTNLGDAFIHDCHRAKGHNLGHQCACGAKQPKQ